MKSDRYTISLKCLVFGRDSREFQTWMWDLQSELSQTVEIQAEWGSLLGTFLYLGTWNPKLSNKTLIPFFSLKILSKPYFSLSLFHSISSCSSFNSTFNSSINSSFYSLNSPFLILLFHLFIEFSFLNFSSPWVPWKYPPKWLPTLHTPPWSSSQLGLRFDLLWETRVTNRLRIKCNSKLKT